MHADLEGLLPPDAQLHISLWAARCEKLLDAKHLTAAVQQFCSQWGVKAPTALRYFYAYKQHGRIGLIDRRKYARFLNDGAVRGLPPQFVEHWKGLNERFQRNGGARHSYRVLMDSLKQWRRGSKDHVIPGYPTPPDNAPGVQHPLGWSYENLTRHLSTLGERALARQGRQAFKKYLPKVHTTRVGIDPGELLQIDDQWDDLNVVWNNGQVARPLSLDLIDVASVCELQDGVAGRFEEDGKKVHLKEEYTFWLLLTHFEREGFHATRGTTVLHESGTACVSEELAAGFLHASEGRIIMDKGAVDRRPVMGMIFPGPAKGSPRFKSLREGRFAFHRTFTALLPGQAGRNPEEAPEEQAAIIRYTERLLSLVPAEQQHLLILPMLKEEQYHERRRLIKAALNNRIDHGFEGWEECGFVEQIFRMPDWPEGKWARLEMLQEAMLQLSPERCELLNMAMISSQEQLITSRRMSPLEVWQASASKRTPLSIWKRNLIIPQHMAHAVTVGDDRMIQVVKDGKPWRFTAKAETHNSHELRFKPRQDLLLYINPLNPSRVLACDVHGTALGIMSLLEAPTRIDYEGYLKRQSEVQEIAREIERDVSLRAGHVTASRVAMANHNAKVVHGLAVTKAQKTTKRAATKAAAVAEDIYDAEPVSTPREPRAEETAITGTDIFDQ
jgi:hypothetical protein